MSSDPPRKLTAVGTTGGVNQLFTVYEKNWECPDCGQDNYAKRPRCSRCRKHKPVCAQFENTVLNPALEAMQSGGGIAWQEVVDPATSHIYYHNKATGVTQWERPVEMGEAPLATGWYGRGKAGSTAAQEYENRNTQYLQRPARKQKDYVDPKAYHTEGANEYNIWYDRYLGDSSDKSSRDPAPSRCVLSSDAGCTKADTGSHHQKRAGVFCIHFAHGMCSRGADCTFYHRIPTPQDNATFNSLHDCFGRQRHSKNKDDMSGVGSFMKPSRTLFIGNLQKSSYSSPKELEDAVWKHFAEWGELESVNVIHRLSIAFARYRLRSSAEFAKEAMMCQALDHGEVLSLRWAHDDPNPVAREAQERADADAMIGLLKARGIALPNVPDSSTAGTDQDGLPDGKRQRVVTSGGWNAGNTEGDDVLVQHPELAYPNTDHQYTTSGQCGDNPEVASDAYFKLLRLPHSASGDNGNGTTSSRLGSSASCSSTSSYGTEGFLATAMAKGDECNGSDTASSGASGAAAGAAGELGDLLKRKRSALEGVLERYAVDGYEEAAPAAPAAVAESAVESRPKTSTDAASTAASVASVSGGVAGAGTEISNEWTQYVDPSSGKPYFHNLLTGQTCWEIPRGNDD